LGAELCRQLGPAAIPLDRQQLDVTDRLAVWRLMTCHRPSVVINAAAYTRVDQAESQPAECMRVNRDAVAWLADACRRLDTLLVQISTDYVFAGHPDRSTPFEESAPVRPLGVYALSKWDGEEQARAWRRHVIVRTCGLYGPPREAANQGNFVLTILRLAASRDRLRVVDDQRCTPSSTRDVARAVLFLAAGQPPGTYHVTNRGDCTWNEFAREIVHHGGFSIPVDPVSSEEYGSPAPRPRYSVLSTNRYDSLGGPPLPHWRTALHAFLDSLPRT
jgi:dTDP-4-dehydrorhamnose reductase